MIQVIFSFPFNHLKQLLAFKYNFLNDNFHIMHCKLIATLMELGKKFETLFVSKVFELFRSLEWMYNQWCSCFFFNIRASWYQEFTKFGSKARDKNKLINNRKKYKIFNYLPLIITFHPRSPFRRKLISLWKENIQKFFFQFACNDNNISQFNTQHFIPEICCIN